MVKKVSLAKLTSSNKSLFLACDQGLEHGPTDFNDKNINPQYIIDIAREGKYNALIFQKGIAEKYNDEIKKSKIPLIIKLNGKTALVKGDPRSSQLCTVKEAIKLGAVAVGYTLYIGSDHEADMFAQFEQIEREAHAAGLPVIAWVYPRGKGVEGTSEGELLAYACRTGLELGADIVKVHYNGNPKDLKWAVKAAGKCKVVIAGGIKTDDTTLIKTISQVMQAGCMGLAIGRNVWQSDHPQELTKKIKSAIWK